VTRREDTETVETEGDEPGEPALEGEVRADRNSGPELDWWQIGGLYLLAIVYVSGVGIAASSVLDVHEAVLASQVVGVLGAALVYRGIRGERAARWAGADRLGMAPGRAVEMAVAVVCLGLAANALMALQVELLPSLQPFAERYERYVDTLLLEAEGVERALGIAGICLAAPLCEEVLFRGAFLSEKLRTGSVRTAVVVNGLLFAAFHQNPVSLVPLAFVGTFLAHLVVMTGTLTSAMLAHGVLNAFNGLVVPRIFPGAETSEITPAEISLLGTEVPLAPEVQLVLVLVLFGAAGGALWAHLARSLGGASGRGRSEDRR